MLVVRRGRIFLWISLDLGMFTNGTSLGLCVRLYPATWHFLLSVLFLSFMPVFNLTRWCHIFMLTTESSPKVQEAYFLWWNQCTGNTTVNGQSRLAPPNGHLCSFFSAKRNFLLKATCCAWGNRAVGLNCWWVTSGNIRQQAVRTALHENNTLSLSWLKTFGSWFRSTAL